MSASTEATSRPATANERQVGGAHYKTGSIQHWDLMVDHDIDYLRGCATAYIARHRRKNGAEDLEKAVHFLQKYQESESRGSMRSVCSIASLLKWASAAGLSAQEVLIMYHILCSPRIDEAISLIQMLSYSDYPPAQQATYPGTPEDGGHHARFSIPVMDVGSD